MGEPRQELHKHLRALCCGQQREALRTLYVHHQRPGERERGCCRDNLERAHARAMCRGERSSLARCNSTAAKRRPAVQTYHQTGRPGTAHARAQSSAGTLLLPSPDLTPHPQPHPTPSALPQPHLQARKERVHGVTAWLPVLHAHRPHHHGHIRRPQLGEHSAHLGAEGGGAREGYEHAGGAFGRGVRDWRGTSLNCQVAAAGLTNGTPTARGTRRRHNSTGAKETSSSHCHAHANANSWRRCSISGLPSQRARGEAGSICSASPQAPLSHPPSPTPGPCTLTLTLS